MASSADAVVCLITAPQPDAGRIAATLVEHGMAACVNVVPVVQSVYRWEGKVEQDDEALLMVKTVRSTIKDIDKILSDIHPYANFEFISLDIVAGSDQYIDWIAGSIDSASP